MSDPNNATARMAAAVNDLTGDPFNPGAGKEVDYIEASDYGYHAVLRDVPAVIEGEYEFVDNDEVSIFDLMD